MELPLSVTFRGMESSPAVAQDIANQVDKLERRFGRIMSCRVVVDAPSKNKTKGGLFHVSVDLKVPGREIAANSTKPKNEAHGDMHVAIRDAFDAIQRRLQDHARKVQGVVKAKDTPIVGHVARLMAEEDYGFIESSDGLDVYFHRNAVVDGNFDKLEVGQEVRIVIDDGEKGPQASTVKPIGKHHPA